MNQGEELHTGRQVAPSGPQTPFCLGTPPRTAAPPAMQSQVSERASHAPHIRAQASASSETFSAHQTPNCKALALTPSSFFSRAFCH